MDEGETDGPPSRQVIALSIDYVLKIADIVTQGAQGDLVTAVVYLAISRANLREAFKSPRTALRHAGVLDAPDDQVRQSVSVLAISRELALPYETTRRHVGKLTTLGLCRRSGDGGVVIPFEVASGEASQTGIDAIWRSTLVFICELDDLRVTYTAKRRRIAPDLRRIAARMAAYYLLDLLNLARASVGLNTQTALLVLAIIRANSLHIARDAEAGPRYARPDTPPPDDMRRPVTTHAIARQLKMPYETARRQVGWLEEAGLCTRRGRGLIVPTSALERPEMLRAIEANWALARSLMENLAGLGLGAAQARRWLQREGRT